MERLMELLENMFKKHNNRQEKMIEQLELMNQALECINRRYGDSDESVSGEV